jgi:putative phosphoesterase
MIRIAVISDTHDWMPPELPARLATADEIWHLGDVCEPDTLAELGALGKPLLVVLGNNESHSLWPLELTVERAGRKIFLTHIPPGRIPAGVEIVLHGHTHVPRDETDANGVRWLNPGCIYRPRRGARAGFAWLMLAEGQPPVWQLEAL